MAVSQSLKETFYFYILQIYTREIVRYYYKIFVYLYIKLKGKIKGLKEICMMEAYCDQRWGEDSNLSDR